MDNTKTLVFMAALLWNNTNHISHNCNNEINPRINITISCRETSFAVMLTLYKAQESLKEEDNKLRRTIFRVMWVR